MQNIKLVTVGDGATGKTCLLITYTTNAFPQEYIPTVFDNYSANVQLDKEIVCLGLWDTGGGEDYGRLRPLSYPQTDVFILCYSVVNMTSFTNCTAMWLPEVNHHCPNAPVILCGTKEDLLYDSAWKSAHPEVKHKAVPTADADALVGKFNVVAHVYTSAMCMLGVKDLFDTAILAALHKGPYARPKPIAPSPGFLGGLFANAPISDWKAYRNVPLLNGRSGASVFRASAYSGVSFFVVGGLGKDGKYEQHPLLSVLLGNNFPLVHHLSQRLPAPSVQLLQRNFAATCVVAGPNTPPVNYVIGGKAAKYLNDVLMLQVGNGAQVQQVAVTNPNVFSPRYGHTAVAMAFNNNSVVVYGGYTADSEPSGELFCFHPRQHHQAQWVVLKPANETLAAPRFHHAAVADDQCMFVFGGKIAGKPSVRLLSQATWIPVVLSGKELPMCVGPSLLAYPEHHCLLVHAEGRIFRLFEKEFSYPVPGGLPVRVAFKCKEVKFTTKLTMYPHAQLVQTQEQRVCLVGGLDVPDSEYLRELKIQFAEDVVKPEKQEKDKGKYCYAKPHLMAPPIPVHKDLQIHSLLVNTHRGPPSIMRNGMMLVGTQVVDWRTFEELGVFSEGDGYTRAYPLALDATHVLTCRGTWNARTILAATSVVELPGRKQPRIIDAPSTDNSACRLLHVNDDLILRVMCRGHNEAFENYHFFGPFNDVSIIHWRSATVRGLPEPDVKIAGEIRWLPLCGRYVAGISGTLVSSLSPAAIDAQYAHLFDVVKSVYIGKVLLQSPELARYQGYPHWRPLSMSGQDYLLCLSHPGKDVHQTRLRYPLIVWYPLDPRPAMVGFIENDELPVMHNGSQEFAHNDVSFHVVQLDVSRFLLCGTSSCTIWRMDANSDGKLPGCTGPLVSLGPDHVLGIFKGKVEKYELRTTKKLWSQPIEGVPISLHNPFVLADTIGSGVIQERRNRQSFFSLIPDEILREVLTAYGTRNFAAEQISATSTHSFLLKCAHGYYRLSVA